MHRALRSRTALALIAALALCGCGSSGSTSQSSTTTTPAASATQTAVSATTSSTTSGGTSSAQGDVSNAGIALASPIALDPLPAHYTCDGANMPPPISWSQIPTNTVEIDLFLFNLVPVHGRLINDWALAGLKPTLHGLSAGLLPPGAIVGRNSYGQMRWSVCPPKGKSVHYAFLLYALPKRVQVKPGFDAEELRATAQHVGGSVGLLGSSYKRA